MSAMTEPERNAFAVMIERLTLALEASQIGDAIDAWLDACEAELEEVERG